MNDIKVLRFISDFDPNQPVSNSHDHATTATTTPPLRWSAQTNNQDFFEQTRKNLNIPDDTLLAIQEEKEADNPTIMCYKPNLECNLNDMRKNDIDTLGIDTLDIQEKHEYAFDMTDKKCMQMYFSKKRSLDDLIPHLPPMPDHVVYDLSLDFKPCEWCPTPLLPDLNPKATVRPHKYLSQKNQHPWDKRIVFVEEPHKYYIDGRCDDWISVTTLIGTFFPDFDAKSQAVSTFQTKSFKDTVHRKSSKYHGCVCPEDIQARWTFWANLGTMLHANIEDYYNNEPYTIHPENEEPFRQFLKLFQDEKWVRWTPFRTEWSIFDPETRVCGQIDFCGMMNQELGHVVLIDWKRCESIPDCCFNRFLGKDPSMGFGVCCDLENCKWTKYSLQLNTYKYLLEKNYGLYVKNMYLIQLHPVLKKNGAAVYKVGNLMRSVEEMMACRKLALLLKAQSRQKSSLQVSPQ